MSDARIDDTARRAHARALVADILTALRYFLLFAAVIAIVFAIRPPENRAGTALGGPDATNPPAASGAAHYLPAADSR